MGDDLTRQAAAAHVGTTFVVTDATGARVTVELVEVAPGPGGGPRPEPFSLLFVGSPEPFLPQGTYGFEHEELGRLDIFVVPLGPDAEGRMRYEAIFN